MSGIKKSSVDSLRSRWIQESVNISNSSPFGFTEGGLIDFRGCDLKMEQFKNLKFRGIDFSHANLFHIRVLDSYFFNCIFDRSNLNESYFAKVEFQDCSFIGADLRWGGMGAPYVVIKNCLFNKAKIKNRLFRGTRFYNVEFDGNIWGGSDFKACHFEYCRFSGNLYNIRFRGAGNVRDEDVEDAGLSEFYLSRIDFSDATFSLVDMRDDCTFSDITLPSDGHVFIDLAENVLNIKNLREWSSEEVTIIDEYVGRIYPNSDNQSCCFVSLQHMLHCGSADLVREVYFRWKELSRDSWR